MIHTETSQGIQLTDATREFMREYAKAAEGGWHHLLKRNDLGFWQVPVRDHLWTQSIERAQQIRTQSDTLVVLGIGGSSLGGRAIQSALRPDSQANLLFFENVDGVEFWRRLSAIQNPSRVHWVIVSKSGNTLETLSQVSFISEWLETKNLSLMKNATVISELRSNPLTDWAKAYDVPVLEIPVDVGGRFSVLTPVGILPAAFLGLDIEQMKRGAQSVQANPKAVIDFAAHALTSWRAGEWITLFWSYCDGMKDFGLWIQQLWAESLAKRTDRSGALAPRVSTPLPLIGANDQHSILQQVMEGHRDKFAVFLRVEESEKAGPQLKKSQFPALNFVAGKPLGALLSAERAATALALREAGVQNVTLQIPRLDEFHLAAGFQFFEMTVGVLGEALNINAYDQPGVELGKRLAREILTR